MGWVVRVAGFLQGGVGCFLQFDELEDFGGLKGVLLLLVLLCAHDCGFRGSKNGIIFSSLELRTLLPRKRLVMLIMK